MAPLPPGYVLRPYTPDDAEVVAGLFNRIEQEPENADSIRARFERYPSKMAVQRLMVEHAGQPVAYGHSVALHEADSGRPVVFIIRADVLPDHESNGVGQHLFAVNEKFAVENGAAWLMSKVRDDQDRGLSFLEQLGYRQEQHLYGVILDLDSFDQPIEVPSGIEIKPWSAFTDDEPNRRRLYACNAESDADTPGIELWGIATFEDWQQSVFESRWYRPDGCLVAIDESGEIVGLTAAGPSDPVNVGIDFTGVVRSHRGRGIARALKVAGAHWAKSIGAKHLHTFNDDRNKPMRHVNFSLGFKPLTGWRMMRKDP